MSAETQPGTQSTPRPDAASIGTVYGVLLNDPATIARLAPAFDTPPYKAAPRAPVLYLKSRNTFATDGSSVPVPASPGVVRIDGTVGAVIGRTASRVSAGDALAHVGGYVVVSDVTLPHDVYYRPAVRMRCRDGFCPMSAATMPVGFDVAAADVTITINDAVVHRRSLSTLVRDLPTLLADITEFMTLDVGDVVLLGPPDAAPLAKPGDRVRIDVPGLGHVTHDLVEEALP